MKLPLGTLVRISVGRFGFRVRVAARVSDVLGPVKMRALKVATPLVVAAVAGVVVRSELVSVTLTLA